jgi:hypothetical protein
MNRKIWKPKDIKLGIYVTRMDGVVSQIVQNPISNTKKESNLVLYNLIRLYKGCMYGKFVRNSDGLQIPYGYSKEEMCDYLNDVANAGGYKLSTLEEVTISIKSVIN